MNKREKALFSMLAVFLMVTVSSVAYAQNTQTIENNQVSRSDIIALGPHIIIPDHFPTIQEGIDNSNLGETIFVRSGIYKENIVVNVNGLSIIGENKFTTIIDGGKTTQDAMNISASEVKIQGFTFTNAINEQRLWDLSGVRIYSSNVTVRENRFVSNRLGISVMASSYNSTIADNSFIGDGIFLGQYQILRSLTKEDFFHNIENNTVNDRPLYYFKDMQDFIVPHDAGQVILANCTNVTMQDLYLSNTDFSIILGYCTNCIIENITVLDTDGEVILLKSDNNIIQNNRLVNNLHGICLDYKSNNNVIKNNYASENFIGISALTSSSNNLIYDNTVTENNAGIYLSAFCCPAQHDNIISNNKAENNDIGISINDNSFDNLIENNTIMNCTIGISLQTSSNNNEIQYNIFKKNLISALFFDCTKNNWNNNYWNRPRILPKPIIGFKLVGKIPIPWVDLDRHPAKQPVSME